MNINKNNYEIYFIDYFDGNLSAEDAAELFLFLESHPELKEEFDMFANVELPEPDDMFPAPDSLKRGVINSENFNWYMAASTEGDLSADEQNMLTEYIKSNPSVSKDVSHFELAHLEPGNEVYPDKNKLKQPVPFIFNINQTIRYAVAAVILLSVVAGGYFIFLKNESTNPTEIAVIPSPQQEQQTDQISNSSENNTATINSVDNNTENTIEEPLNQTSPHQDNNSVVNENKSIIKTNRKSNIQPIEKLQSKNTNLLLVADINIATKPNDSLSIMEVEPASELVAETTPASEEKYVSVWEAIRQGAENNLRKVSGSDDGALASAGNEEKSPVRLINVIGKGIEKVSNDKVKVESNYDEGGKLSAFQFAAGKFKIERKKGF